jgi:hypothetical protein
LSGNLIAGHDYRLSTNRFITSAGTINLRIISEPATAWLVGAGLVAFAANGRRRTDASG